MRRKSLSEKDVTTVIAVFESILEDNQHNWSKMNRFIGSMTLDEMLVLNQKLKKWAYGEPKDPEDEQWDYDDADDYSSNAPCDTYGMCAGTSCSHYYQCH